MPYLPYLKDTPVPTILVVAGILFILLAIAGSFKPFEIPPLTSLWQKWVAGTLGGLFVIVGLLVYLSPISPPGITHPSPGTPTATNMPQPTVICCSPTPTLSGMVFDNFNNDIGGWGIIGKDVSYAQDNGNGVLRFNPPDRGPAEASKSVNSAALSEFRGISLRINLHGATLVAPSDDANYRTASALYLDQNGEKFVGLYNYIKNSYDGWQNVYIPLTDFTGFDKAASFSRLGFRFWLYKAGTIDVDDITFVS